MPAGRDHADSSRSSIHSSRRATWAELLQRVFAFDALTCPHCGGKRKLIALITERAVVRKILAHLGLPSEPPRLARRPIPNSPSTHDANSRSPAVPPENPTRVAATR